MAKRFVSSRLQAPSTALYPSLDDDGVEIKKLNSDIPNQWQVKSYVDAENIYSAKLRTKWTVVMHKDPNRENYWISDRIYIDINDRE